MAIESQTMTTLAFSRESTDVAKTIKARLKFLGIIADAPRTLPHARDDGSARAYLMLSPHPRDRP